MMILGWAGLGLAACTSPEAQHQADLEACQSYGFTAGTAEFANCMQRQQLARNQGGVFPSIGLGIGGGSFGGGGFGGGGIGLGF